MTDESVAAWAREVLGTEVDAIERIAVGFSRSTFRVQTADGRDVVVRLDAPDGPFAGTAISLVREQRVHEALARTDLPRPALLAAAADGSGLVFEHVPGTPALDHLDQAARDRIFDDYLGHIAELHRIDVGALGLDVPRVGPLSNPLLADLDLWETTLHSRVRRPWPLLRQAFALLRELAPELGDAPPVLCHGDVGPRNFLHDDERVTALLDWEFWHLGEPYDDLAWWIWRAHERSTGGGDLGHQLRYWSQRSGLPLDAGRIDYYQIVVKLRSLVVAAIALDHATRGIDHSVLLPVAWTLGYQIARDLLHLRGVVLELDVVLAVDPAAELGADALRFLRRDVTDLLVPTASTPEARRQASAVLVYAEHLDAVARYGAAVRRADEADLAAAGFGRTRSGTGGRDDPAGIDDRLAAAARSGLPADEVMRLLGRSAYRRLRLWPSACARTDMPPIRVTELVGIGTLERAGG